MLNKPISRRTFLKIFGASAATGAAGTFGSYFYATNVEPAWLDVRARTIPIARLDAAFDGYRIAQISDIHTDDTWMSQARLQEIVRLVEAQNPDCVVLTGDFITTQPQFFVDQLVAGLHGIGAPDGVFAVLGNHDYWSDGSGDTVRPALIELGINELRDEIHTLRRNNARLHIVGKDETWQEAFHLQTMATYRPDIERLAAQLPADDPAILLLHEPDFADIVADIGRFDLQLSGHSHGGQVQIPLRGAPQLPPMGRKYYDGLYRVGQMWQYTSRGVGMVHPQVRFNCRPDISLLELRQG